MFKTISDFIETELTEKKSKFIAHLYYVSSEEEAKEKIQECKKKYHDARHNCYAYRVVVDDKIIENFSDDGEPSGTAGNPMLSILQGNDLANVLIIVTRYFGGVLLGTGGLVRAYSGALELAIEEAEFIICTEGLEAGLRMEYSEYSKFEYYASKHGLRIINSEFQERVYVIIECEQSSYDELEKNAEELDFQFDRLNIIRRKIIKLER